MFRQGRAPVSWKSYYSIHGIFEILPQGCSLPYGYGNTLDSFLPCYTKVTHSHIPSHNHSHPYQRHKPTSQASLSVSSLCASTSLHCTQQSLPLHPTLFHSSNSFPPPLSGWLLLSPSSRVSPPPRNATQTPINSRRASPTRVRRAC